MHQTSEEKQKAHVPPNWDVGDLIEVVYEHGIMFSHDSNEDDFIVRQGERFIFVGFYPASHHEVPALMFDDDAIVIKGITTSGIGWRQSVWVDAEVFKRMTND